MACDPNVMCLSELACKQIVKIKLKAGLIVELYETCCSIVIFGVNFNVISDISLRPRLADKLCYTVAQNS